MVVIIISSVVLVINIVLWIFVIGIIKKEFSVDGNLEEIRIEVDKLIKEIDRVTDRNLTLIDSKTAYLNELMEKTDKKIKLFNSEVSKRDLEKNTLRQISSEMEKTSESKSSETEKNHGSKKSPSVKKNEVVAKAAQSYKKNMGDDNYQLFTENAGTSDFQRSIEVFDMPMTDGEKSQVVTSDTGLKIKISENPIKPKAVSGTQILELADQGFSSDLIAQKLSIPAAEVEMMLALNGRI